MFSNRWNPQSDMPDLQGKVAIVTGGNAGIGYSTIRFLALAGAKVYMASRSAARAAAAIESLHHDNTTLKRDAVVFLELDLSSIMSVNRAAADFKARESRLDILVNNGAMALETFETTDAGFESTMAACHIGHFVLVDRLLPVLKATAAQPGSDVRVVTVSSNTQTAMMPADFDFNFSSPTSLTAPGIPHPKWWPLSPFLLRYAIAKAANSIFAAELQRRLDNDKVPIISLSLHPGGVATKSAEGIFWSFLVPVMRALFATPDTGAITSLFAATAPEVREKEAEFKGQYLVPYGKIGVPHQAVKDRQVALDLWRTTRTEVNKYMTTNGLEPLSI